MAQDKDEIIHFADSFMHHISQATFDEDSDSRSVMDSIIQERNTLFRLHQLDFLSEQDKTLIRDYVMNHWDNFLNDSAITPEQQNAFINTLFFDEGAITPDEQQRYKTVIENFQRSQSINELYFFGGVLTDTPDEFEDSIKSIFEQLEYSQKAEVLANLSVFIEHYNKTALGKKFIDSVNQKDTNQWFHELIDNMKGHTPLPFRLNYNSDTNTIDYKEQPSGLYDGLFFLPVKNDDNQLQINATAQFNSRWEGSSIQRHMLSNVIISKALNIFFEGEAEQDNQIYRNPHTNKVITDSDKLLTAKMHSYVTYGLALKDTSHDNNGNAHNRTMASTIIEAVNGFLDESFDNMKTMVKQLNKAPLHYLRKAINDNSNTPITKEQLDYFIDNADVFVTSQSFFLSHVPAVKRTEKAKASPLWQNEFNTNNFTPEEFRVKSQCLGFLGQFIDKTAKGQGEIDLNALYELFEAKLKIRASTRDDTLHNDRFMALNLKSFEAAVMRNFVLNDPEAINKNHLAIDQSTRENINGYLWAFFRYHDEQSFDQKMTDLGIENPPSFETAIQNLSESNYNDVVLADKLQDKQALNQERELKLINKGLREIRKGEQTYKTFINEKNVGQTSQKIIEELKDKYDGDDLEAEINDIAKVKEDIRLKNNDNFEYPNYKIDKTSENSLSQEESIRIKNQEQKNGNEFKPK